MAMSIDPGANRPHSFGSAATAAANDLDRQRLRILRCTAHAMASSPGGLRFSAGTRPWLDGLPTNQSVVAGRNRLNPDAGPRPVAT